MHNGEVIPMMPPVTGASPSFLPNEIGLTAEIRPFLEVLHFKNRGQAAYERVLVMAIDKEWFQFGGRNVLLSCQVSVVSSEKAINRIFYTRIGTRLKKGLSIDGHLSSSADAVGERWSLEEIVEMGMVARDGGKLVNRKSGCTRVILVAHNTVAEWSMLADRDHAYITKNLKSIRKSPVTGMHPIKFRNRRIGKIDLEIADTRLLAPAGLQSLAALSSMLGEGEEKIDVPEKYKRNMHELLRDDPQLFERYSLRDTEVTMKLFFLLQRLLNELAYGSINRPFKTLASAAVKGFLRRNDWFEEYRERLSEGPFGAVMPIIKRAYLGGLNMGCYRGDTAAFEQTRDYIFVDIDFANAYANGMARCPKIDLDGEVDVVQAEYCWSDTAEQTLQRENLPPDLIARAKAAVGEGREAVEKLLLELRSVKKLKVKGRSREWKLKWLQLRQRQTRRDRAHALILRDTLFVTNNRHLDRWVKQSNESGLSAEIPGFAKVRFTSPPDLSFPCLPIKAPPYGLAYVLEGDTVVPASELVLAVKAGVKVEVFWSVELPVEKDQEGNAKLYFFDHLKHLVKLRAEAKKKAKASPEAAAIEKIIKEFINGFYGKSAQGLNFRRMYNPATGEFFPLTPSEMTEPSVAALTTAQVRAALASTLLAVEAYNKTRAGERPIVVISATTDGLLIGIPCQPGYSVTEEFFDNPSPEEIAQGKPPRMKNVKFQSFLERFGHEGLLEAFYSYTPIQQLRLMRQQLTGEDDFLEIKHLADRVVSVKTRGQIGMISYCGREYCSLIARYGHKIPLSLIYEDPEVYSALMKGDRNTADAHWFFERIEKSLTESDIERYAFQNLTSFKAIHESEGELDLVNLVTMRRTNSDPDYKRHFVRGADGRLSPISVPHKNVAAMLRERRQADAIRKGGQNASPELVEQRLRVKGRGCRARSGHAAMLTRAFLRGIVQGKISTSVELAETAIAGIIDAVWQDLGVKPGKRWSRADVNNARRAQWEANVLIHNPAHEQLLTKLCSAFEVEPENARRQLFATDIVERCLASLAQTVAQAILIGPKLGIEPFASMHRQGALPGKSVLAERLHPQLNGQTLSISSSFPAPVPAADRSVLRRLFGLAGLSGPEARQCAEALAPVQEVGRTPRRNPTEKQCLELFVTALHQPDLHPYEIKTSEVVKRLKRFGLRKRGFYTARGKTLSARSLQSTAGNRRQIEQMASALELDATKFLGALLEAS